MKNLKIILSAIVLIFSVNAFSQRSSIDSLLSLIKKDKADTNKVIHLNTLCIKFKNTGIYDSALFYGNNALQLSQQLNFNRGITSSYNKIGNIYISQGNYPTALDCYLKALKMNEELNNKKGIAINLGNIGLVYQNQEDNSKALNYFLRALKMAEELGHKQLQANTLSNIGNIYSLQADYTKSLYFLLKALKIAEELGNKNNYAAVLGNIGHNYYKQTNYSKALDYNFKILKIFEEIEDKEGIANSSGNIGSIYATTGKFKEAEVYFKKAIILYDDLGALNNLRIFEKELSQIYDTTAQIALSNGQFTKAAKNFKLSILYYKKAVALKDTIFSQENKKELVRKEMNFEFEKKEAITKAVAEGETRKQKIITFSVTGGLLMVMVFAGFIFRSLRVTKKQKLVIEQQKQLVEEHQKEIISSITYAKRLQEAILPPIPSIKKQFPESFILYNPKDVVAGDFYWMEIMDNIQFIAAADCTGHGVPGAMMSVVCSNALNRAVKEFGLRDTGLILDKVTDLVLETFEKSDSNVKDGMDISILAYNKGNNQIQWSGANNPLWYIQNGNMFEIKADKQPIGLSDNRKPFTTHNITYSENSLFYLFTDGYADQFGGPKGKKFMYKKFKDNLTAICSLSLNEQEKALQTEFNGWKGSLEQVDDVTVIGVRV